MTHLLMGLLRELRSLRCICSTYDKCSTYGYNVCLWQSDANLAMIQKRGLTPPLFSSFSSPRRERSPCAGPHIDSTHALGVRTVDLRACVRFFSIDDRITESVLSLSVLTHSLTLFPLYRRDYINRW
jgi:hypothetical protein